MNVSPIPGTVVIYGPHFARSGFGLLARVWAMAFHSAGIKVRIVPIDCNNPESAGDLDDCDLYLLRSLQYTPITGPVTAIFAYVPTYVWPRMPLPEPHLRIMLTTFDSTANAATPPSRQIYMCNQMDQVWVANPAEERAWIRGGLDPSRIRSFNWPHNWIDSSVLPPIKAPEAHSGPFRFLHISLLLPRRRLDVLLRAFFEEFSQQGEAELVLKMTYPSWHPVAGKPQRDLKAMIERLRIEAGSKATVVLDETMGTRLDLVRLIDSCDAYVSTDTTHTAPVAEAIIRHLPVIITDGWGVDLPPQALVVPNSTDDVAITAEMADYMPHQRGASFPNLDVGLVRAALRRIFSSNATERTVAAQAAAQYMRERYSCSAAAPFAIEAIREGWASKSNPITILERTLSKKGNDSVRDSFLESFDALPPSEIPRPLAIHWSGLQLFHGKLPKFNREITLELIRRGHRLSLTPGNGPFHVEERDLTESPKFVELADRFHRPLSGPVDVNVSCRWHPIFNEQPATRQILANPWWSGSIPVEWVRPIRESVSEVWVPSDFVRENFIAGGIDAARLKIVPMGVDTEVFHPGATPFPLQTRKGFKFLFVGETSTRRGFDILLAVYLRNFTSRDDVCLVVKDMDCQDYYGRLMMRRHISEARSNPQNPAIEYLPAMLSEGELAGLYVACDCVVQPHRTASFNLAVLEAIACNRPVITTDFGGVRDFLKKESSFLIPAKIVRQRPAKVGHWTVQGEQLHAEPNQTALLERMRHFYQNTTEARRLGANSGLHVRENFRWKHSANIILSRMQAVLAADDLRTKTARPAQAAGATITSSSAIGTTVVVYAPFYNRSGYGVAARSLVSAWHAAGVRIKIMPVDDVEDGVDDCDLPLLRSLEKTPVTTPVVAVFFHVATPAWLKVTLPPNSARILFTTFDGTAQGIKPPADWVAICNQMDQLWLQTEKEAEVFAAAGVIRNKIHTLKCPHHWLNNAALPTPEPRIIGQRFRFLSIAMFQPRRRWDTLIEAFLLEFRDTPNGELYLKVNYPLWHPIPGKPARDLRQLIDSLKAKTGSSASVIVDEDLGTRAGICRLIDSCDTYVSTDTTITAPVGEAFVRGKIAVIPDGYGAKLPYCEGALIIPVDPKSTGPMTEEMLQYQPHHRGREMPLLRIEDVRQTMRAAYELPESQRQEMGRQASLAMDCTYSPAYITPSYLRAIDQAVQDKIASAQRAVAVTWEGSFLDYGSLSFVNRALTEALSKNGGIDLNRVGNATLSGSAAQSEELQSVAKMMRPKAANDVQITVRHQWPPDWSRPKQGSLVVIQPWEFGSLPQDWVRRSSDVDEFWAYTHYVRNVYISSGVDASKVKVVPLGIDPTVFRPDVQPRILATSKRFKFLFVGGTIGRKGPDLLLKAYLENFTATDDVCLVIKDFGGASVYAGQTLETQIKVIQANPTAPEILYLSEELPPDALPGLYRACDSLVHPYRGEGFGLPIIEAMACGLPVIVTAGGSADDFATDEFAYRIPAARRSIGDSVSGLKLVGDGWMLEPDIAALGTRMKWVVAHPDKATQLGARAADHVRSQWTWERSATIASDRLQAIATRQRAPLVSAKSIMARKFTPPKLPAVAQIGDLTKAHELFRKKSPRAAWENTCEAIRVRPFHPEAFLLLAEIARLVGNSAGARNCARHALDLAPAFKPARKFLQGNLSGTTKPDWLAMPPQVEAGMAKITPRLTVCLIVKNEERLIGQCLSSVKNIADQIIVVDTGSTDRTMAIAREFGAEIREFKWCDDFSVARNAALEQATGDWVMSLDADEEVPLENHAALRALLDHDSVIGWRLPKFEVGRETEGPTHMQRLFRNAPGLYFTSRVYADVSQTLEVQRKEWGLDTRLGEVAFRYHRSTEETMQEGDKSSLHLRLLEQSIRETPDDPVTLMHYGLTLMRAERHEDGLRQYQAAFTLLSERPESLAREFCETLLTQYSTHLLTVRNPAEVRLVLTSPLAQNGDLTSTLHFLLGQAYFELHDFAAAAQQFRHCLAKRDTAALTPVNPAIFKATPRHFIALCLGRIKDDTGAEIEFQAAIAEDPDEAVIQVDYANFLHARGKTVESLQLLNQFALSHPEATEVWIAGGQIALSQPTLIEVAMDWTAVSSHHHPQNLTLFAQRAETVMLSGNTSEALPLWRQLANEGHPRAQAARILCETVLGTQSSSPAASALKSINDEFVRHYWKLVDFGAEATVLKLLEQVEALASVLPDSAGMLRSIVNELNAPVAP